MTFARRRLLPALSLLIASGAGGALPAAAQTAAGAAAGVPFSALSGKDAPAGSIWLDSLDVARASQDYGKPGVGRSVDGNPLTVHGTVYPHGLGTHASGQLIVDLHGAATRFTTLAGVDDEKDGAASGHASVRFTVVVDGKTVARTPVLRGGDAPALLSVDLTGAKRMILQVDDGDDGIDNDHADWAGALLTLAPGATTPPFTVGIAPVAAPAASAAPVEPARLIVPTPDPKPAIHGPRVVGSTPGRPFLFRISATGQAPLTFSASDLPEGLTLDPATGILSGALKKQGTSIVWLKVKGPKGEAKRALTIVGEPHRLALTPPMGWNSWNLWATRVDADKVKAAADAMISSGLAAHGFQYVNIDDAWEAGRDSQGRILTNEKFPDMKGLADYVHSKGLKIGIYSSPGPWTCGGYTGTFAHHDDDAKSWADWGFDYIKYDWCSYGSVASGRDVASRRWPYLLLRRSLDQVDRDILFSFCQYGDGSVWTWGAATGGNCWRTTGDINDSWNNVRGIIKKQAQLGQYAGPGHWNDPDMLVVGTVGWGKLHPTRLTPNEQVQHISLWCLLSAPLLIGCDMTQLDDLTLALLSNDEALDINQDPMGKPAMLVRSQDDGGEIWARELFDGTHAVGLCNSAPEARKVTVRWSDLGISGRQDVRDLWLHMNVGSFRGEYTVDVPAHGAVLIKVGKPRKGSDVDPYVPALLPEWAYTAPPAEPAQPRPAVALAAPPVVRHDFGALSAQAAKDGVTHTFTVTNTGAAPATLDRAEVSCGCTAARFLDAAGSGVTLPVTLQPGQSVQVQVTVDTSILAPGAIDKIVWLYAAGNAAPYRTLEIKGTLPQ